MPLVYMDGFDAGDWATRYTVVDSASGQGTVSTVRPGTTGLGFRFTSGSSSPTGLVRTITPTTAVLVGVAMKGEPPFNSSYPARMLILGSATQSNHIQIRCESGATWAVYRFNTLVGTFTASTSSWFYLEVKATLDDTAGQIEIRVNGAVVFTFTGDTRNGGTDTQWTQVGFGDSSGSNGDIGECLIDDVYIFSASSFAGLTYVGEIQVKALPANAAGTYTGLTPQGSATNYQNVDEFPPSTTDYNYSTVAGTKDTYGVADITLNPGDRIVAVQSSAVVSTINPGAGNARMITRTEGTDYNSASTAVSAAARTVSQMFETNPNTSTPWTQSQVNAIEVGVEVL